ncbi:hypothetical protein MUCCIDRAFT_167015 [Mucor lusitanicus CBS 277.49]|uniref:Uncharacterized protein n=1 Tax=Mucor lusitanicus CBS 277.49 TaxID=747725 RepID=A0A168I683_MUCCL|nr:hypothetical protein MUCCIDRAFT_167015 [Mucor lusitanicus CBS 277.49]
MPGQRRRTQNINDLIDSNASGYVPLPQLPSQYMNAMNGDYAYAQAVEEAAQQTADKAKKVRPKNTTKSYERRKKEFLEWCHKHCPPGALNEIPDDRKLHFFLVTQVVNREYKKKGTKRKQPQDSQVENSDATPSSSAEVDQSLPTDSDLLQTGEIPGEVLADSQLRDELLERAAMTSDTGSLVAESNATG